MIIINYGSEFIYFYEKQLYFVFKKFIFVFNKQHIFYFFIEKVKLEKKKKTSMIKNNLGQTKLCFESIFKKITLLCHPFLNFPRHNISKVFFKNIILLLLLLFCFKLIFFIFLNYFNVLISKITFKNKKYFKK